MFSLYGLGESSCGQQTFMDPVTEQVLLYVLQKTKEIPKTPNLKKFPGNSLLPM